MQPTREQVLEWAKAEGLWFDDGWIFYTPKRPSLQEPEVYAFVAAMNAAYAAGIEKGLDMATDVCKRRRDYEMIQDRMSASMCASDCAKTIEQLKGKP